MTAVTTILEAFLCFTLLAVPSWQAAATTTTTTPAMSPPTHDELTTSLVVNQLAILHLMQDSSNTSCAAAEMQRECDVDREDSKRLEQAQGERMDRLLAVLEVQQKAQGERMDRLLAVLEVQQNASGERMDRLLAALEVQQQTHSQQVLDTLNNNAALKTPECEEGWEMFELSCYWRSDTGDTWTNANTKCAEEGAYLASITSEAEQIFIQERLTQTAWIGLHDIVDTNHFTWDDSSKLVYTNWASEEPNHDDENCVEMRITHDDEWNNNLCSTINAYICEKPPQ